MRRISALAFCLTFSLQGSLVVFHPLKEIAEVRVLVVGRVVDVQKQPDGAAIAQIDVLRVCAPGETNPPQPGDRLRLSYRTYADGVNVNGPNWLVLKVGQAYVLPLRAVDPSKLFAEDGINIVIPVRADLPESEPQPAARRPFLLREIANALALGTVQEAFGVSGFLVNEHEDLSPELMPLLEDRAGVDLQRWAEMGTNLLAADGVPHPTVADLIAGKAAGNPSALRNFRLVQAIFQKLPPSDATDRLIIQTMLAYVPVHAWGSANTLLEFKDHPALIEGITDALRRNVAGSSYVAWVLVRNGQKAILPDALARALRVTDSMGADPIDMQGAGPLLRDFGSDAQLDQFANIIRKYRFVNLQHFNQLWQSTVPDRNPRAARILAVLVPDRRIAFGQQRYCDLAVTYLEQAVGEHFGPPGDAAVAKASAWLDAQGIRHD